MFLLCKLLTRKLIPVITSKVIYLPGFPGGPGLPGGPLRPTLGTIDGITRFAAISWNRARANK